MTFTATIAPTPAVPAVPVGLVLAAIDYLAQHDQAAVRGEIASIALNCERLLSCGGV